tara:strand:+ start:350 stop:535 length:186 start_codon:yes stop_codon:yes gene_type:complete
MKYNVTYVKEITYQTTVEAENRDDAIQVWGSDPYNQNEKIIKVVQKEPSADVHDPRDLVIH